MTRYAHASLVLAGWVLASCQRPADAQPGRGSVTDPNRPSKPKPDPEAPGERFERDMMIRFHMHASFDLARAIELALPNRAAITLLHVQEPSVAWGEVRPFDVYAEVSSDATKTLERWGQELAAKVSVPVHQKMRVGRAGAQLLAVLDDDPTVDLVVMGSHGRTGITRLALGSVAEKTVRHARCPVAVTHHRG